MAEEKRKFSRIFFPMEVRLEGAGIALNGAVRDLSVKSLFVVTEQRPPVGALVAVRLCPQGWELRKALLLQGEIIRMETEGVVVDFREMSMETFQHLRNLVMYNNNGLVGAE